MKCWVPSWTPSDKKSRFMEATFLGLPVEPVKIIQRNFYQKAGMPGALKALIVFVFLSIVSVLRPVFCGVAFLRILY